jgi:hypothetical protein
MQRAHLASVIGHGSWQRNACPHSGPPQKKENYPPTHIMSYDGTGITVVERAENSLCDAGAI